VPLSVQKRREKQKAELRSELLDAAHKLVKEEGYEGLTIRKLANRVIEAHPSDDPIEALKAVMTEYAAFGLGNPNEYRTVFMTEKTKLPEGRSYEDMEEGNPAMKALISRVEACVAAGKLHGDARAIATMLWAVGHGTISLLITFPFYPFGDPQAFVKRMCDSTLASLTAQDVPPLTKTPVNC
jgi:AcrR family transcriptional regulator